MPAAFPNSTAPLRESPSASILCNNGRNLLPCTPVSQPTGQNAIPACLLSFRTGRNEIQSGWINHPSTLELISGSWISYPTPLNSIPMAWISYQTAFYRIPARWMTYHAPMPMEMAHSRCIRAASRTLVQNSNWIPEKTGIGFRRKQKLDPEGIRDFSRGSERNERFPRNRAREGNAPWRGARVPKGIN